MLSRLRAFAVTVLALALVMAWAGLVHAKPDAVDVRIGAEAGKTRFVLELTEAPSYRVFSLPNPYRVVIDLPALNWRLPTDRDSWHKGAVQALRFGLFSPVTSRVVLDLSQPVSVDKAFVLEPSNGARYRLVVDLVPISREAFLSPAQRAPKVSDTPLPTVRRAALPTAPQRPTSDARPTVVIDAGHGGIDPGATGVAGTLEKDLMLGYAREVKRQLEASGRFRVVMTRDSDVFLSLRDRVAVAQSANADVFLSLHANTHGKSGIRGASVFSLSERASDAEAAALAAKENKADIIAGVDLSDQTDVISMILIDLAQRETMNQSTRFARQLIGELEGKVKLVKNPRRSAGFVVLKSPDVPSLLFEVGYMSNKQEEKLLLSQAHKKKISAAIVRAVEKFFTWQESVKRS